MALVLSLLGYMLVFLTVKALPALSLFSSQALWSGGWYPEDGEFHLGMALLGSVAVAGLACLLGVPLALACALSIHALSIHGLSQTLWQRVLATALEVLNGVPSVVFGVMGLMVVVPLVGEFGSPGPSLLAGSVVLAMMILPMTALLIYQGLDSLPEELLKGAKALALGPFATFFWVIRPRLKGVVFNAALLALARSMGETVAVLMVCGNVAGWPESIFAPVRTLTGNIGLEMAYALGEHRQVLFLSGWLLVVLVCGLVALIRWKGAPS